MAFNQATCLFSQLCIWYRICSPHWCFRIIMLFCMFILLLVTLFLFTLTCRPSLSHMFMALVYQLLEEVCYKPSESAFSDALQLYNASKNHYQDKLPCKSKHGCSPVHKYSTTKGVITEDPLTRNNFLTLHAYSLLQ